MNKKILYSILLSTVLFSPIIVVAENFSLSQAAKGLQSMMMTIGISVVIIGWVIAGMMYLLSQGDPGKMGKAKTAMVAAIIGTILVVIAQWGYEWIKSIIYNALQGS